MVPRILPRVVLELAPQQHVDALTGGKSTVIQMLAKEARRQGFDGLVGNLWPLLHLQLPQHERDGQPSPTKPVIWAGHCVDTNAGSGGVECLGSVRHSSTP